MEVRYAPEQRASSFWKRVTKTDNCWNWTGPLQNGYGKVCVHGKGVSAHRYSYELAYGTIPQGMCVCHKCDNRACVRPDHLFLGTFNDNNQDMKRKGRQATGVRHGSQTHPESRPNGHLIPTSKLLPQQVAEIRQRYNNGERNQSLLAREYGVSQAAIWWILKGRNWKHIN